VSQRIGSWRVAFADGAPRQALVRILESLEAGAEADELAEVDEIKRSQVRHVFRTRLPDDTAAYVKRYLADGARSELRSRLGGSRARHEFRNLRRLVDLGVAAVEPLCCAELRRRGRLVEAVLVTRALAAAVPLRERLRGLAETERRGLVESLARVARRLHDEGLWHRDLHMGNVLTVLDPDDGVRPVLVDVQKMRSLHVPLPATLRARDLAMLGAGLADGPQPSRPSRLVEAYAAAGRSPSDAARLQARIDAAGRRRALRRLQSRGRRCVKRSSGFRVERSGPLRIYRRADVDAPALLAAIEAHRVRLESGEGPARSLIRSRAVALSRLDGVRGGPPAGPPARLFDRGQGAPEPGSPALATVAVRELREAGWLRFQRRRRGMAAWRGAHAAMLRGFETPAPLALVEARRLGRVRRSYLVFRWDDGVECLGSRLARRAGPPAGEAGEPSRGSAARPVQEVGRFLARLHAAGLHYRHLRLDRLLVREHPGSAFQGDGTLGFLLLDQDELCIGRRPGRRRRVENLARLAAGIGARLPDLPRAEVASLLASYCDGSGAAEEAWRALVASTS
jgi:tRNA A-37 threonylcarbamoyl transferase component Bud32